MAEILLMDLGVFVTGVLAGVAVVVAWRQLSRRGLDTCPTCLGAGAVRLHHGHNAP